MSISRRTLLRGMGVSLALPWMESLVPAATAAEAAAAKTRMAFIFVPNGVHLPKWTPKAEGYGFDVPHILEPLKPLQDKLMVLSGLTHDKGRSNDDGPGDHARSASVFLTGAQPRKTDGEKIRSGVSVDQLAAQAVGQRTRFSSIELGVDPGRQAGSCDSGYSCAYSSNISWSSETTPVGKEVNPRLVFERLFAGGSKQEIDQSQAERQAMRSSILDYISQDAKALERNLGKKDQRKLDEYMTGVREIERRLDASENMSLDTDVDYEAPAGIPKDYREHLRLMCDMMVLAFQTDSTRIATMMFANAGDNKNYRNIGVPDGHHDLSHHRDDPEKLAKITRINRFHTEQLSYFLEKLNEVEEEDGGTLLDNSMIVYGSGISDGNRHNNENLPVLLAGGGSGTIDSGRHIRYATETPLCNLYMSLLERMGADVPFIGDSTGSLPNLTI